MWCYLCHQYFCGFQGSPKMMFFFFLDKSYDSLTADVFRLSKIKSKDRYKKLYDMHNGLFIDLGVISRTIIAVIR